MRYEIRERQQLRGGQSAREQADCNKSSRDCHEPGIESKPRRNQREQNQPCKQYFLRATRENLHSCGQRGEKELSSPGCPALLGKQNHPRHPPKGCQMAWPHEEVQRKSVERKNH